MQLPQTFPRPYKYGKSRANITDAHGVIQKYPLVLGEARALRSLTSDYVFFTPAILYLSGLFSDAVLIDFMQGVGTEVRFYHHKFQAPIFRGLLTPDGDEDWNYVLWAIRKPFWKAFQDFLCSVTITKPDRRLLVGIGYQELKVLDPLTVDKHRIVTAESSVLGVGAFGLNGNKYIFAFQPSADPRVTLPLVQRYQPGQGMNAFAEALFAGKNPNDARAKAEGFKAKGVGWEYNIQ